MFRHSCYAEPNDFREMGGPCTIILICTFPDLSVICTLDFPPKQGYRSLICTLDFPNWSVPLICCRGKASWSVPLVSPTAKKEVQITKSRKNNGTDQLGGMICTLVLICTHDWSEIKVLIEKQGYRSTLEQWSKIRVLIEKQGYRSTHFFWCHFWRPFFSTSVFPKLICTLAFPGFCDLYPFFGFWSVPWIFHGPRIRQCGF